jgi:sarcosine oxidase
VGGGPVGAAVAWQLARRGTEVMLIERRGPRHRAGPVHDVWRTYGPTSAAPAYRRLADEALALWRELEAETGADLVRVTGGVDHGDPARLEDVADSLLASGVPHEWLTVHEAATRWPGMAFDRRVLHRPSTSGRLHADHSVAALAAAATGHGAIVRHHARVTEIAVHGPSWVDLRVAAPGRTVEVIHARRVVVAAGEWTSGLVDGVVGLPPVRVAEERSAYFQVAESLLPCGACTVPWPTFVHHGTIGVYGLPAPGQGVKVSVRGADADLLTHPGGTDPGPHQARGLRDYVSRWLPGADPATCVQTVRADTSGPGSEFVLERRGPVVVGTGLSGAGFTFVPALGRILADLASRTAPSVGALDPSELYAR